MRSRRGRKTWWKSRRQRRHSWREHVRRDTRVQSWNCGRGRGWRRGWQRIHGWVHHTVIVEREVVVSMSCHQCKRSSACRVHGSIAGPPSAPSQVLTAHTSGENKRFLWCYSGLPSNVRGIQHSMRFGVLDKSFHSSVNFLRTIFLD
jgi:hypothetical protein